MRPPFIPSRDALLERLRSPGQVPPTTPEAALPDYLESFLAHLRLLVGVPFEYLVPDPRLLPPESLRFFYLDRSWADRVVDGALSVGKVGSREQAHHQEHDAALRSRLDVTERVVRVLQRGLAPFAAAVAGAAGAEAPAGVVTGLILRSAAVSGWPQMDVRAFDAHVADDAPPAELAAHALPLLRLERIAPSVLFALFEGVPRLVWLEEPLSGVPVAVVPTGQGYRLVGRPAVTVPLRSRARRVVHVAALRRAILDADAALPADAGSGVLAEALLGRAYRQRFEGRGTRPVVDGFAPSVSVAARADEPGVAHRVRELFP